MSSPSIIFGLSEFPRPPQMGYFYTHHKQVCPSNVLGVFQSGESPRRFLVRGKLQPRFGF